MTHIYDQPDIHNLNAERHQSLFAMNGGSAVSWGAIFAGATATASLALILLMLGAGLGLTSVSPWNNHGLSSGTIGIAAIAWLAFTQIVASGMGGYLAGRLRTKWVDTHTNEIYFRDTVHGFLTWAVASLVSAVLLTTTIGSIVGGGAKIIGTVAGGTTATSMNSIANVTNSSSAFSDSSVEYFIHSLFRTSNTATIENNLPSTNSQQPNPITTNDPLLHKSISPALLGEITGIFTHSIFTGPLPQEDLQYVAQLISQNTGINQSEAEQRVKSIYDKAQTKLRETKIESQKIADNVRKTTSYVTLWTFISLLIGAFIASLCATFGGRQRDL